MNWYLGNSWYLLLLLLLPLLIFLIYRFAKWKTARKDAFADSRFQKELFQTSDKFIKFFPVLYLIAVLFLILSIVDFLSGTEEIKSEQNVNNIIFALDVSNSMNAQDIEPNRLTAAKNIMIQSLSNLKDDKVGIVIFAGDAVSIMPLTTDYAAASTYISGIESSIMPTQGTDFLRAMRIAVDKFKNIPKGSRRLILISDGEDNEGNEQDALKLAKSEGISVVTVGLGTEAGAPVPEYIFGQLMGYKVSADGQTVISKREIIALKDLAEGTGGSYIDGNNLEDATANIKAALTEKIGTSSSIVNSQTAIHYYQYSLGISIFFFILILLFNPKRGFNI